MKKLIYGLTIFSMLAAMTACGHEVALPEETKPHVNAVTTNFTTSVTTETSATTTVTDVAVTTVSGESAISAVSADAETVSAAVSEKTVSSAEAEKNVQNLPKIDSAEIVAVYNDYGDGYMYRLDTKGDYAYWNAEFTGISACQDYNFSFSSKSLTDADPFVTGGSTITELSAVVTPYDQNGNAGSPISVIWDPNRKEHEAERLFGSDHDTADLSGCYPYSEAVRERSGSLSVKDIEGEWLHGQFVLNIFNCDRLSGRFEDANEDGSYSGDVRLEYSISGDTVEFWYNLYTDDGIIFKGFKATENTPVNAMNDVRDRGIIHERIIRAN